MFRIIQLFFSDLVDAVFSIFEVRTLPTDLTAFYSFIEVEEFSGLIPLLTSSSNSHLRHFPLILTFYYLQHLYITFLLFTKSHFYIFYFAFHFIITLSLDTMKFLLKGIFIYFDKRLSWMLNLCKFLKYTIFIWFNIFSKDGWRKKQ